MTGLTLDQFKEIVEFTHAFHKFGKYYEPEECTAIRMLYPKWENKSIKYIDSCYDSRTNDVWVVTFRRGGLNMVFNGNDSETPLFDRVMQYLKGGEDET